MFDFSHPFYRPLWRRILIVAVCLGWALVEMTSGSPGFALLFGAAGGYAGWRLLIAWPPKMQDDEDMT